MPVSNLDDAKQGTFRLLKDLPGDSIKVSYAANLGFKSPKGRSESRYTC